MSDKLAVKHKNSLALKENKLLVQGGSKPKNYKEPSRPFQLILFPIITCCIFLCYWIILCPLLFNSLYVRSKSTNSKNWPRLWPFYYWLVALLIWLLIMVILIIIWRRLKSKYNNEKLSKSYGSSDSEKPVYLVNVKNTYPENVTLHKIEKDDAKQAKSTDYKESNHTKANNEACNEARKSRDLPPLVIHRQMSGIDIENTGTVTVEEKTHNPDKAEQLFEAEDDKKSRNVNRDSIKEYLKLVTVTPSEDELDVKSPKGPLSPRELFFIDLIREAEKAESNKESKDPKVPERRHFFPNDFHAPENSNTNKTAEDQEKVLTNNTASTPSQESSYFIANVQSPSSEKTEVFLEIKPQQEMSKEWSVDLSNERPALMIENNPDTKDHTLPEDIVVFEV